MHQDHPKRLNRLRRNGSGERARRDSNPQPSDPYGGSLLTDTQYTPLTRDIIRNAVEGAISYAGQREATLVLAFLGHGFSVGASGLYYMAPESQLGDALSAVRVDALLETAAAQRNIDGVLALVDTCFAAGAVPSTTQLTSGIRNGRTRMALLMAASATQSAYGLSFTKELNRQLIAGIAGQDELLDFDALHCAIASRLHHQTPTLLTYLAGHPIRSGTNLGLWLCRNQEGLNSWNGTLDVDWVRELTATYCDTDARGALHTALENHRLVALRGPAGSGKSTLLAGFTNEKRPGGRALHALAFCEPRHTLAALAEQISDQLAATLLGGYRQEFLEARDRGRKAAQVTTGVDAWNVSLVQPLSRLTGVRAVIGIDGVDQLDSSVRRALGASVRQFLMNCPAGLRIVVSDRCNTSKGWPNFDETVRPSRLSPDLVTRWLKELDEPTAIREALTRRPWGREYDWLLARLLLDLSRDNLSASATPGDLPFDLKSAYDQLHVRAVNGCGGAVDDVRVLEAILAAAGPARYRSP